MQISKTSKLVLIVGSVLILLIGLIIGLQVNFAWDDEEYEKQQCNIGNEEECGLAYTSTCDYFGIWSKELNFKVVLFRSCRII